MAGRTQGTRRVKRQARFNERQARFNERQARFNERQARFNERPARFNEVFILKVGVAVTAVLGIVLLASVFFVPTEIKLLGRGGGQSEARKQLIEKLELLSAAWEPKQRQRLLDEAPELAQDFAGPLDRILRMGHPTLLEAAVEYAGALGVAELRPTLVHMTSSSSGALPAGIRAKAMKSAEQLGSWSREQLAAFLTEGTPPMQLAALEICASRQDAPWSEVLELLNSGSGGDTVASQKLSAAAIKAIPENPPAELVAALWEMVAHGSPDTVVLGLKALSRARLEAGLYVRLARRLDRLDRQAQLICLDLLGQRKPLPDPAPVWALITRPETSPRVRARALYCLEQTDSFDAERIRKQVFFMDPLAKYFAARCLIAADHRDGARILLDLVDEEEEDLSVASRRLLAWMTGKAPATSREGFQSSLAGTQRHCAGCLPAPGYDFGNPSATPGSPR